MAGQSLKWMVLVATIWIQAFTGTNFDFSAYSSDLKSVLAISQVQLNYLAVASDLGKAFGWSSGLALLYLPIWTVLFIAASLGFVGYGLQWLVIRNLISLPYILADLPADLLRICPLFYDPPVQTDCGSMFLRNKLIGSDFHTCQVFLLCLLSGLSICWFNTVCFVLCIRNFTTNRSLALSLTISFNGVSAALYTLAAGALSTSAASASGPTYLILNAALPLLVSAAALLPILRQEQRQPPHRIPPETAAHDSVLFLLLNVFAFLTGLYLLLLDAPSPTVDRLLFGGALLLLVLPLCVPGVICARNWAHRTITSSFRINGGASGFSLVDIDELELHKSLLIKEDEEEKWRWWRCCWKNDRMTMLGEEHGASKLVRRIDFWLYYATYFCGATVGLVYINNLGQIAQSLGRYSDTATLVTVYSACSFFGRLFSSAPDFLRGKIYFARTGWLALALMPMPVAFFVLAGSDSLHALTVATALIGLSSGFIFAAAVSVTSELFGPESVGVNHNILITNIPLGSLLYGLLAALVYDANEGSSSFITSPLNDGAVVCMGRKCYGETFMTWGCISMFGLAASVVLFLRTKPAYDRFERDRIAMPLV
ncbi:hypothetical protein QJS10_CPA10g01287 [Acorus calamus]|uniref:Nodulin-like domain-containing protein n=1 Tax=Acorus calamus TaxID=4465 RepID=A0AAV9DWI6_ACOCL|nr:hypothetical protein QJS10_CPA10g01287 [Acorus calamus]